MKQKNKTKLILFIFCLLCFSCVKNNCLKENKIKNKIKLSFLKKEDIVSNLKSFEEFDGFINQNPILARRFFETQNSISKKQKLFTLINNVYFDTLYTEVKKTFGSFDNQKEEFQNAFTRLIKQLPHIRPPKITTIISGFYNDVVVTEKEIIIGLDYFLESDSKYKPKDIPEYILKRYNPSNLVPMTMSVYCSQFNKINLEDQTMLAEMLNFGRLYFLLESILPCVPPNKIIGYTKEEWDLVEENEEKIYSVFVERKLFYETNHLVKNKYLSERPRVFEISPDCPGRIGLWLGWKITKSYMQQNPNISIVELLNNTNSQEIFLQSFYKPS